MHLGSRNQRTTSPIKQDSIAAMRRLLSKGRVGLGRRAPGDPIVQRVANQLVIKCRVFVIDLI